MTKEKSITGGEVEAWLEALTSFLYELSQWGNEVGHEAECLGQSLPMIRGRLKTTGDAYRNPALPDPHPEYGPCDAIHPSGACAECLRLYGKDEVSGEVEKGVDLDALKREATIWYDKQFGKGVTMPTDRQVMYEYIDHLASTGRIRMIAMTLDCLLDQKRTDYERGYEEGLAAAEKHYAKLNFNDICSQIYKLQCEVWKAVNGSWYCKIWSDELNPDVNYLSHASTAQEAVDLAIKYMEADND